jgi:hypothetical protein
MLKYSVFMEKEVRFQLIFSLFFRLNNRMATSQIEDSGLRKRADLAGTGPYALTWDSSSIYLIILENFHTS